MWPSFCAKNLGQLPSRLIFPHVRVTPERFCMGNIAWGVFLLTANHPRLPPLTLSLLELLSSPLFALSLYLPHCPSSRAIYIKSFATFNQKQFRKMIFYYFSYLKCFFFGAFFHLHLISATTLTHVSYSVSCSEGSWAADTVLNIDWRTYDNKEWLQRVCLLVSCDGFWWIAQPPCIGEVRITSRQQRGRHEQDF